MADSTSSTTGSPGGITIIPEDEEAASNWFRENPVFTGLIAGGILLLIVVIIFCIIRRKRNASISKEVNLNDTETAAAAELPEDITGNNALPESFVIIQSPNLHTRPPPKRKSTLAVPPLFSVSHSSQRKSAPSAPHDLRPPVVGWTRWSTAGLEIHTTPPPAPPGVPQENPLPRGYARKKRQSTPGIMMAVPVVFRRVSQAPHHAVYVPEHSSNPPKPLTP